ncbi:hypothetical protein [[Mycoplasma] collis]|uniref:hypothetical protein n=1 Tax=[Mycoplasma] collis TaxID=2127 RepID=UPI00051ABB64|nr:hypothetical protein [[Mycoplasma] collis]
MNKIWNKLLKNNLTQKEKSDLHHLIKESQSYSISALQNSSPFKSLIQKHNISKNELINFLNGNFSIKKINKIDKNWLPYFINWEKKNENKTLSFSNKFLDIWTKKSFKINVKYLMLLKNQKISLQILICILFLIKLSKQKTFLISEIQLIYSFNFDFVKSSFYYALKELQNKKIIIIKNDEISLNKKLALTNEFVLLHKDEFASVLKNLTAQKILFIHQAKILLLKAKTTKEKKNWCSCSWREKEFGNHYDCKTLEINKSNKFTFKVFKRLKIRNSKIYYLIKNKKFLKILKANFNIEICFEKSFDKFRKHIKTFHNIGFRQLIALG